MIQVTGRIIYRVSPPTRVLVTTVVVAFVAAAAFTLLLVDKPWGNRLGGSCFFLGGAVVSWAIGLRPRLELDADTAVLVRPVGSTRIPLADVESASGGRLLTLHLRSGAALRVLAVSNSNPTLLLNRSGRTETVAHEINLHLAERQKPRAP